MKNILKTVLAFALSVLSATAIAQNNTIFFGGIGDGNALGNYAEAYTDFRKGGTGDGNTLDNYAQAYTDVHKGGTGDGNALGNYAQAYTDVHKGGIGDGNASGSYAQAYTDIRTGGLGDGNASGSYTQAYTDFRKGGGGDGWASNVLPMLPLPLTLLSFTGREAENGVHLLQWQTVQEINTAYFDVEYTVNTAAAYRTIGTVAGTGNDAGKQDYSFINEHPQAGNNFYRLKMVDNDGKATYSNVVLLKVLASKAVLLVYPNPAASALNIRLANTCGNAAVDIEVYDMAGRIMTCQSLQSGNTTISLDVSHYAAGNYVIKIKNNGSEDTVKFVKQ